MTVKSPVCEKELPDHADFFKNFGDAAEPLQNDNKLPMDSDGVCRWVYELPMAKSFFLLFEIWRVIILSAALIVIVMAVINLLSGNGLQGAADAVGMGLLVLAILMVLSLPAYWIVTKANNGKYTVLFEMDEEGIDHTQIKTDKAKALEALTVLAGKRTGNHTTAGAGMLSAAGTSLYTRFSDVRKIQADASKYLIQLKGKLIRNQVYADPEHYDLVLDYITSRCPQAEIIRK